MRLVSRKDNNMAENDVTWADFAAQLYDKLTGKGSKINYQFDDLNIDVPDKIGANATHTRWTLNGSLKISTENN